MDSGHATDNRYVEGFLAGQAIAYCERVTTGMSMAAQLVCPESYKDKICQLVTGEGCKVLAESRGSDQASIWIYRDELAVQLITNLQSAPASELGIWSMGKLLGYANHEVTSFID